MTWLTAAAFARRHNVHRSTVCRALKQGRIPEARQLGKRWAIPPDADLHPCLPVALPSPLQDRDPGSDVATADRPDGVRPPPEDPQPLKNNRDFDIDGAGSLASMPSADSPLERADLAFLRLMARCGCLDTAAQFAGLPARRARSLLGDTAALAFLRREQGKAVLEGAGAAIGALRSIALDPAATPNARVNASAQLARLAGLDRAASAVNPVQQSEEPLDRDGRLGSAAEFDQVLTVLRQLASTNAPDER